MTNVELTHLFKLYLHREPTKAEHNLHGKKAYVNFEREIQDCEERKRIIRSQKASPEKSKYRIAFLISGHVRNNHLLNSLVDNFQYHNYDVFIHTWDTRGKKGMEMKLETQSERKLVEEEIKKFPNLADYEIENNAAYIKKIEKEDRKVIYFNHSSPERFIKSQLYSINRSWEIFEKHLKKNPDKKYDIVVRIRFDIAFEEVNIDDDLIKDINEFPIIFFPNSPGPHPHPDHGTSCIICDKMYYDWNLKYPHITEHPTVVCDVFSYGSVDSMRAYCSLHEKYAEYAKIFEGKNLRSMKLRKSDKLIKSENGKDYMVTDSGEAHFYYHGTYPERMLSYHLQDHMLVESKKIKLNPRILR